eukprot:TRINITY_DN88365_c0_g1_i1.p1 TRINITY_DN88365_c0_g1~~TRINITY_DN88365_c0_g1_i1.p1  ORF type:complete len:1664 (-),score=262.62 TRINITY_DN88365_c0_g1_i1:4-4995(-)
MGLRHFSRIACFCFVVAAGRRISHAIDDERDSSATNQRTDRLADHADDTENTDRIRCLRQDNLDLTGICSGSSRCVLRRIFARSNDSVDNDVYVFAKELVIRRIEGELTLKRLSGNLLSFQLNGAHWHKDQSVGLAELLLSGFQIVTRSKAVKWATSLAANTELLKQGQHGSLYFSFRGTVRAIKKSGLLEPELVSTKVDYFKLQFENQRILETALNRYGGLDNVVIDKLFTLITGTIPISLLGAMEHLPLTPSLPASHQHLWFSAMVKLNGTTRELEKHMDLNAQLALKVHIEPARLLQVLTSHFDVHEMAKAQVQRFLGDEDVQKKWKQNREAFIKTLKQYRLFSGHMGKAYGVVMNATDIEDLKPVLIEAAEGLADVLLRNLKPFTDAHVQGKRDIFQGLLLRMAGRAGWSKDSGNGQLWADLGPADVLDVAGYQPEHPVWQRQDAERATFLKLPSQLLDVFNLSEKLPRSGNNDSIVVNLVGLSLLTTAIQLKHLEVKNMLYMFTAGVEQLWRIEDASLSDISLQLPKSLERSFQIFSDAWDVRLTPKGDIEADGTVMGTRIRAEEGWMLSSKSGKLRAGELEEIDGALPQAFARPSEAKPPLSPVVLAPAAVGNISVTVVGNSNSLTFDMETDLRVSLDTSRVSEYLFNPAVTEDFGYVFFAHEFRLRRESEGQGEKRAEVQVSQVIAVVSCGFMRLLEAPLPTKPTRRIDAPALIDLTKYLEAPVLEPRASEACLDVYSSGQPTKNSWRSRTRKRHLLCSTDPDPLSRLREAIQMQVRRFQDGRARAWNFGTHPTEREQYVLPSDRVAADLSNILQTPRTVATESRRSTNQSRTDLLLQHAVEKRAMAREPELLTADLVSSALAESVLLEVLDGTGRSDRSHSVQLASGPETSIDRQRCQAQEHLDSWFFPPEEFGEAAIRTTFPGTAIGDVHLVVDKIQVINFEMDLKLERRGDRVFTFEISGREEGRHAPIDLWFEGLGFHLPDNPLLGSFAQAFSSVESWFSKLFSKGKSHKGRLDASRLCLLVYMRGEFELDRSGAWQVNRETAESDVIIHFGSGGVLQRLIDKLIEAYGSVNELFSKNVWPLFSKIIPAKVGKAFEAVPKRIGTLSHELHIEGKCKSRQGKACPEDELEIRFSEIMPLDLALAPFLESYTSQFNETASGSSTSESKPVGYELMRNFVSTAAQGSVLKHSYVSLAAELSYAHNEATKVEVLGTTELDTSFVESMIGDAELLLQVIPALPQQLLLEGKMRVAPEGLAVDNASLRHFRIPYAVGNGTRGESDFFAVNATIDHVRALPVKWNSGDLLSLDANLEIRADREAVHLQERARRSVMNLSLRPAWMEAVLASPRANWTTPSNVRTAPKEMADGVLPHEFQRRWAVMPATIDPVRILTNLNLTSMLELHGQEAISGQPESLRMSFNLVASADLRLGRRFWRELSDRSAVDNGFIHFSIRGSSSEKIADKIFPLYSTSASPVLLELACGQLTMYNLKDGGPYAEIFLKHDLAEVGRDDGLYRGGILAALVVDSGNRTCLRVNTEKELLKTRERYFCSKDVPKMYKLHEALKLQLLRFSNVGEAALTGRAADDLIQQTVLSSGGRVQDHFVSEPRPVLRDSTWFRRVYPPQMLPPKSVEDVETPQQRWYKALAESQSELRHEP